MTNLKRQLVLSLHNLGRTPKQIATAGNMSTAEVKRILAGPAVKPGTPADDHAFRLSLWRRLKRFRIFDGERELLGVYAECESLATIDADKLLGPAKSIAQHYTARPVVKEPYRFRMGEWTWGQ